MTAPSASPLPPRAQPAPTTAPGTTATTPSRAAPAAAGERTSPTAPAVPAGTGSDNGKLNLDGSTPGTPEAPPGSASAPLNLELHGKREGPGNSSRPQSGLLPLLSAPPDHKSQLSKDLDKAAKPDCAQAYSGAGLLAVLPMAKDAITGKGCKF
jgi:hypothetical protein